MAQSAPQIYDLPQLHRQMIEVLGVKNADKLVPTQDDLKPTDPVSENMDALNGKPLKAFIYQDHDAHITTHQAFMQDPMVAQMIGQNPQGQAIMAALQAHLAQHLGFNYRKQMEEKLGASLPAPNEELPENIEVTLAQLMAKAGTQLTQAHQQQAAQTQAQQQAQDPVLQLQQQELAIKQQEAQRKAQKDAADIELRRAEQQRKVQKDQVDAALDVEQLKLDKQELSIEAQKEGVKIALDKQNNKEKLDLELMRLIEQQNKGQ
jgi:hypothetical protein